MDASRIVVRIEKWKTGIEMGTRWNASYHASRWSFESPHVVSYSEKAKSRWGHGPDGSGSYSTCPYHFTMKGGIDYEDEDDGAGGGDNSALKVSSSERGT